MSPQPRRSTTETTGGTDAAPEHEAIALGNQPADGSPSATTAAGKPAGSAKMPDTKPYRVCIAGASYRSPIITTDFDGSESVVFAALVATFGEEIELTTREAGRLKDLGAIKGAGEPLSYEEMDDKQLDGAVKERGVTVISSGADADQPLRVDKINALNTFDQGRQVTR